MVEINHSQSHKKCHSYPNKWIIVNIVSLHLIKSSKFLVEKVKVNSFLIQNELVLQSV